MRTVIFTLSAACTALALCAAAAGLTVGDKAFIERAGRDGQAEYQLAKLGEQKAMREEVRQFAARMVEDHGKANDELAKIAGDKGEEIPADPGKDFHRAQQKLGALSGPDFDREFMAIMAKDHKKVVRVFAKQAKRGSDPDLRAFAARQLPTLQSHLRAAEVTRDVTRMPSSPAAAR